MRPFLPRIPILLGMFLALFSGEPIEAQGCIPPPGVYSMTIEPSTISATVCPDVTFSFNVTVDPGDTTVAGFGFNIEIGCPGRVVSIFPAFEFGGGGFITHVGPDGQTVAALGLQGPEEPGLSHLVTIVFEPEVVGVPSNFEINFGGTLSLPSGMVPTDHVVESTTACDIVAPMLGLRGAKINLSPCAGNFIRGDCNNNGLVAGLTGDIWFMLRFLFLEDEMEPECEIACDANDDNNIDVADAIYLLSWMFTRGPMPPDPSPMQGAGFDSCGPDPTPGVLTCENGICP